MGQATEKGQGEGKDAVSCQDLATALGAAAVLVHLEEDPEWDGGQVLERLEPEMGQEQASF